ncbi:hypothetical protein BC827DRAFT_1272005 [Russula dissimulans]|nr:hypothetical protein BC827DRAFT_1272005 [Russula dissimulans]
MELCRLAAPQDALVRARFVSASRQRVRYLCILVLCYASLTVPRLCSDADFMWNIQQRYNALATRGDSSSASRVRIFTILISALKHLVASRPSLLGVSGGNGGNGGQCDGVERRWDNRYGSGPKRAKCSNESAVLNKAYAPPIPEAHIYLLGVKFLVSLSNNLAGYAIPLYNTLAVQNPRSGSSEAVRAPGPPDPLMPPETETEPARVGLLARATRSTFLLPNKPLGPPLRRCPRRNLGTRLPTPHDDFITAPAKAARRPRVVAAPDEPPLPTPVTRSPVSLEGLTLGLAGGGGGGEPPQPPGLGQRNLAFFHALVAAAVFLAGQTIITLDGGMQRTAFF